MRGMRLASRPPIRCSGCYGQYPDRAHIDFESAYDGPTTDASNPRAPKLDWVVLCEECVRAAHDRLPNVVDRTLALRQRIDSLESELAETQRYADKLEDAMGSRPDRKPRAPKQRTRYQPREAA